MDGRTRVFLDEEAAVAELTTGCFWDKMLIDKRLFEIDEGEQLGQKQGKTREKMGRKKNFHFGDFSVKKWEKVELLRSRTASVFSASSAILQRTLIADAMALRAPRCRLCALWGLASPPHPHGSVVRFTPILKMKRVLRRRKGRLRRRIAKARVPFVPLSLPSLVPCALRARAH